MHYIAYIRIYDLLTTTKRGYYFVTRLAMDVVEVVVRLLLLQCWLT